MGKFLIVDQPNKDTLFLPYNNANKAKYNLDEGDQAILEADETLWKGEIAFTLDEDDEEM